MRTLRVSTGAVALPALLASLPGQAFVRGDDSSPFKIASSISGYIFHAAPPPNRGPGVCAMRGSCGKKGIFGQPLPCPYDGAAVKPDNDDFRSSLVDTCGADFASGPVCCTAEQVETLSTNLARAEPLISSCPACHNNFRDFWCSFTCSPDQSQFLGVVKTQKTDEGKAAVKTVEYHVGKEFAEGFYDSCKDVKFGATNGYAMELLGAGAKNYSQFFAFLGKEDPLVGSPFQINFPPPPANGPSISTVDDYSNGRQLGKSDDATVLGRAAFTPYNPPPRNCSSSALDSRCACVDCPQVCTVLPVVDPPHTGHQCQVGAVSCLTFFMLLVYALGLVSFVVGYGTTATIKRRRGRQIMSWATSSSGGYERVRLSGDERGSASTLGSTASHGQLIGATSLGHGFDGEDSESPATSDRPRLGRGAALLDPIESLQPRQYKFNVILQRVFHQVGLFCASKPWLTLALAALVIGLLNLGWLRFEVETNPVRLWVAKTSESKARKDFFDEKFGPFYRSEQIFVTAAHEGGARNIPTKEHGEPDLDQLEPALSWDRLNWWADVEGRIRSLRSEPHGYTLEDVCFKPGGDLGGGSYDCVVESIMGYFGDDLSTVDKNSWKSYLDDCADSPSTCLPYFGQPLKKQLVLGGLPETVRERDPDSLPGEGSIITRPGRPSDARAWVVTFVVSNSLNVTERAKAEEWERALEALLKEVASEEGLGSERKEQGVDIAFSTESSLKEEINESTNTDVRIVVLSYVVMFFYAALTLGGTSASAQAGGSARPAVTAASRSQGLFHRLFSALSFRRQQEGEIALGRHASRRRRLGWIARRLFVDSKFTLGLFGICIVLLSVSSSVGLFSLLGVRVTLIIAEVIPFLVLAIGVDNIFILSNELDRQNALASTSNPYGGITGRGGHSPFGVARGSDGGLGMGHEYDANLVDDFGSDDDDLSLGPAYHLPPEERVARSLARMGPSILLSATTEVIAFAMGALVPMPAVRNFAIYAAGSVAIDALLQCTVFVSAMSVDLKRVESYRVDCLPCIKVARPAGEAAAGVGLGGENAVARFIRRFYAPFLLKRPVKAVVIAVFSGLFAASIISIQHVQMGLDQRLALPAESYLVDYFNDVDAFLGVGPPVYFVTRDIDTSMRVGQQSLCGRFTTCDDLSVANVLEAERKRPESSFISEPAASWIDDFLQWLNPVLETCCRVKKSDPSQFCTESDSEYNCQPCFAGHEPPYNITMDGLPEGAEFQRYLEQWLASSTNEDCPLGGKAAYSAAIAIDTSGNHSVQASHFRTYHTPLKSQADFIDAFAAAHRIAEDISQRTGAQVFPYSLFYVFFDQYAHLLAITREVIALTLVAIFLVTSLLLGSWRTGAVVTVTCAMTVVDVAGVMGLWEISLNAISLVNLVISLGIAVEFCSHIARAFMGAGGGLPYHHPDGQKERDERAWNALVDVGSSVFSGITLTKLIGISVLALTRSKLLEIYYFRMWLSLIVLGALHGLIFLPVALSYFGGQGYALDGEDEDEVRRVLRAHDQEEFHPFIADGGGDDSDTEAY